MVLEIDGTGWAKFFTGFAFALEKVNAGIAINCVFERDRLRILHVYRFAIAQAAVIGIGNLLGAFFRAGITGNTFGHVDIAGVPGQLDFKVALFAADALHFGKR